MEHSSTLSKYLTSIDQFPKNILALGPNNSYQFFNLNLTDKQKQALNNLAINKTDTIVIYNSLENLINLTNNFLKSVGESDTQISLEVAKIILEIVLRIIKIFNQETAQVIIRASLPNDMFKIPRWHTDGYYYMPHSGYQYKAAVTLIGPGTLFHKLANEQREAFNQICDNRVETSKMLNNVIPETSDTSKGALFIAGHKEHSAVHSEPHINCKRLFFSVVPGSFEQINEMKDIQEQAENNPQIQEMLAKLVKKQFKM